MYVDVVKNGAPIKVLTPVDSERLAQLREQAAHEVRSATAAVAARQPEGTLEALAWVAGVDGANPTDPTMLRNLIDRARAERLSWREIADAVGEGGSQSDARRIRDRHRLWTSR